MIPRKQIDIGGSDLAAGLLRCFWPGRASRAQRALEEAWGQGEPVVATLSVRSGLDLVLRTLALPSGSEVLVSAVTIRDMVTILEAHGLKVVPVPVDLDRLEVPIEAVEAAVTPETRAILVAHLFGARMALGPLARLAKDRELLLLEDCAQAYDGNEYRGDPGADVAMFSFGPIKTNTALGGGLLRFRSPELAQRVRNLQEELPPQRRRSFAARLLKYAAIWALLHRLTFTGFVALCRARDRSHDEVISGAVRGFAGRELLPAIRHRPSYPLLALMLRRIRAFRSDRMNERSTLARTLLAAVPHLKAPGTQAEHHTHWVVPVWVEDPDRAVRELWWHGIDATRGASSLHAIPRSHTETRPRTESGEMRPGPPKGFRSEDAMASVLYLPCHPKLSDRDLATIRTVLRGVA